MTDYLTAEALSERVREALQVHGYTQTQLAAILDCDQAAVNRAVKGHESYIRVLIEIAAVLGLDVDRDDRGRGVRYYRLSE